MRIPEFFLRLLLNRHPCADRSAYGSDAASGMATVKLVRFRRKTYFPFSVSSARNESCPWSFRCFTSTSKSRSFFSSFTFAAPFFLRKSHFKGDSHGSSGSGQGTEADPHCVSKMPVLEISSRCRRWSITYD